MKNDQLKVSICVPAYNEEKNIKKILDKLGNQRLEFVSINRIVVVSSGSTDRTVQIVQNMQKENEHIDLIHETNRNGKAAAINKFLQSVDDPVVVIESADTIPHEDTIEKLCRPFIEDDNIGMTGGAPIPVNDPNTFLGYIIHAWWWFHRNIPRFGEIIAYRNILPQIAETSSVDEAYIQAALIKKKFKIVHIDAARILNKGPETVRDLIKQRRRIFNGHSRLHNDESVKINNMTRSSLKLLLFKFQIKSLKHLLWLSGGIGIEIVSRILGAYDQHISKINPHVWDTASTTKDLHVEVKKTP